MKLSIIIPVYNREWCLEETLLSILEQKGYSYEIEVIIVDDGSTDKSIAICEEFAKRNTFIKVFKQKNQGAGQARNNGLLSATGDYIWFVDSDDWLERNALSNLQKHLYKGYDAITFNVADLQMGGAKTLRHPYDNISGKIMTGNEFLSKRMVCSFISTHADFSVAPWRTVYNKAYLINQGLKMSTKVSIGEDYVFTLQAYYNLQKLLVINDVLYLIRNSPVSLTNSTSFKKKACDCLINADSLFDFIQRKKSKYNRIYYTLISHSIISSFTYIWKSERYCDKEYVAKFERNKTQYCISLLKSYNSKFIVTAFIFSIIPPTTSIYIYNKLLANLSLFQIKKRIIK